jgi:hypothetical protein
MNMAGDVRVAIGLPIRAASEAAAATRIVVFLLQSTIRGELSLVSNNPSRLLRRLPAVLLVAANVDLASDDLAATGRSLGPSQSATLSASWRRSSAVS